MEHITRLNCGSLVTLLEYEHDANEIRAEFLRIFSLLYYEM